jgi:iron complex transport system substrate-binding protein
MNGKLKKCAASLLGLMAVMTMVSVSGCDKKSAPDSSPTVQKRAEPLIIQHQLGTTRIDAVPQRVAVLDMNEADFLDQLNVPIAGMPKDFIPHFLAKYQQNHDDIADLGGIVQPNMERVHTLKPDLILMTPIQKDHYQELTQIAPTLYYEINFNNSEHGHLATVKNHLLTLGKIFNREDLARTKVAELDAQVNKVRAITKDRPEKALVVLYNNGAFSNYGVDSRYGFVFSDLGVRSASNDASTSLHGQPISSEFIKRADPDILYIIDRTSVMQHQPVITAAQVTNPLLRATKAWKNNRVIFVDADAWYTTGASPTSMYLLMQDVMKGYQ